MAGVVVAVFDLADAAHHVRIRGDGLPEREGRSGEARREGQGERLTQHVYLLGRTRPRDTPRAHGRQAPRGAGPRLQPWRRRCGGADEEGDDLARVYALGIARRGRIPSPRSATTRGRGQRAR